MTEAIVGFIINFFAGLFNKALGSWSRDKAQQVSGELDAEGGILDASIERAKNAQKVSDDISGLSDDELDERLRGNKPVQPKSQS